MVNTFPEREAPTENKKPLEGPPHRMDGVGLSSRVCYAGMRLDAGGGVSLTM